VNFLLISLVFEAFHVLVQSKGNASFSSGNFQEAIGHFTAAIELDESNHVLYSNRSACQVCLYAREGIVAWYQYLIGQLSMAMV
jgi:tetratricopeptide (TPR) repeat protein